MIIRIVIFLLTSKAVELALRKTPSTNYPTVNLPPQDETAVVIKQGVVNFRHMIPVGIDNYKELIDKSKAFIDNTILIKELVAKSKQTVLLCPNKWGKSTILTMLEMFLEIPVDEQGARLPPEDTPNWRFFYNGTLPNSNETLGQPLLISKHTMIMKYFLAKFPVVYVNFENVTGSDAAEMKDKIGSVIGETFKKHKYMIKVLEKKGEQAARFSSNFTNHDLIAFEEYLNNKATHNITHSLQFLTRILNDHFRQASFVLVDNYDAPIHNFLQIDNYKRGDVKEISHLMESLAVNTFKNNEYLFLALNAGTHMLGSPWNSYRTYHIAQETTPLREYFAFTYEDVQVLLKKQDIPHSVAKQAFSWYDGFESAYSKQHFYNSHSLLNFLQNQEISCYWTEKERSKHFIRKVLKMKLASSIRREILLLLSNQTIPIRENLILDPQVIDQLRKLFSDEPKMYIPGSWFFSYLLAEGYLKKLPDAKPDEFELIPAVLPNHEIACVMANWMISFYKQEFQIKENLLRRAADTLKTFIRSDGVQLTAQLQESLTALYKDGASSLNKFANHWDNEAASAPEDPSHAIFHCVALEMQRDTRFEIDVYYSKSKTADVVMVDNGIGNGVIAQLVYNQSSPQEAVNFAENCSEIFVDLIEVRNMKFVGIHISSDATVQILSKFMKIDF